MSRLKNILLHCEEAERQYEEMGLACRDRDINQGWIECCKFFFNNFDVEEKTINIGD
tara:strand:+ start:1317 stop:1487 length:171 start_codon:yes stop_codon:yes gene_type:complete